MTKLHLGAMQEKKENGEKFKIVDSSPIEKNASFLVERGFTHVFFLFISTHHYLHATMQCPILRIATLTKSTE